ncbi:MAG TPA: NUDIX domain-containing protein [Solirubrobacteraceae bacterium]|nr:NUDIX domain-containing protein [Solirubrobacteraceae bacterium]
MKAGRDYIGVGVGAVIIDRGAVLLLKRKKPPEAGHWSIPGGRVEFGETLETAIVREIKEELGCDAKVVASLGVTDHIVESEGVHWVSPRFLVTITGQPENLEPETHDAVEWFDVSGPPANITKTTRAALLALTESTGEGPASS